MTTRANMNQRPLTRQHNLAKVGVESSNLFARSSWNQKELGFGRAFLFLAPWAA